MAKVAREIVEKRPAEIIEACRKLYKVKSFKTSMVIKILLTTIWKC